MREYQEVSEKIINLIEKLQKQNEELKKEKRMQIEYTLPHYNFDEENKHELFRND